MVTFVETDYTEPDIRYTLIGTAGGNDPDTGDIYRGLDRFGRIVDSYWYDYGSTSDVDRIKYGYDRSGNRLWRENVVARSLSKEFDELYTYDAVHRLKDMSRGTLNSGHSSLDSTTFAQCWGLDETGNWSNFREDDDGNGSWNLNQDRTANKVNEISDITESTGPSWTTPAYSKAGNMTTVPKPADPTTSFTATYDAWNRLTKLVDTTSSDTVAEYEYDGAKRRTIQKSYDNGTLDETRHLYYTEPSKWQVIEERVDSGTDPNRQFVWGLRYIDDLVLRDRDTTGNGTLDERLYALQDANWNVTTIADSSGTVQQRFTYSAYGTRLFLTSAFAAGTNSANWETLSGGYRRDDETSFYTIRHRVLNCVIGAWLQRDPLGYIDSASLYAYAKNSPCVFTDSAGTVTGIDCPCSPPGSPNNWPPPDWPPAAPPPPFPTAGSSQKKKTNEKTWIGWNFCLCGAEKKKDRATPNPNPGPAPTPIPLGPASGNSTFYPPGSSGPIGAGGCAPCIAVVASCPTGMAVLHFTAGDSAAATIGNYSWPAGCEAVVCGGDDTPQSNCLADQTIDALTDHGISILTVQPTSACGFNADGTIFASGS